jgi:uncharacterized membrane protein (DUF441 family)
MERLSSRKLWIAVGGAAIVALAEQFGVELDPEQVITFGSIIVAYITGQAIVDKNKVQAEVDASVAGLKLEANAIISALNARLQEFQVQPATPSERAEANTELA